LQNFFNSFLIFESYHLFLEGNLIRFRSYCTEFPLS